MVRTPPPQPPLAGEPVGSACWHRPGYLEVSLDFEQANAPKHTPMWASQGEACVLGSRLSSTQATSRVQQALSVHILVGGNKGEHRLAAGDLQVQASGPKGPEDRVWGSETWPDMACGWPLAHRPHPLTPLFPEGALPERGPHVCPQSQDPGQPTGPGSQVPSVCLGVGATAAASVAQRGQGSAAKPEPPPRSAPVPFCMLSLSPCFHCPRVGVSSTHPCPPPPGRTTPPAWHPRPFSHNLQLRHGEQFGPDKAT